MTTTLVIVFSLACGAAVSLLVLVAAHTGRFSRAPIHQETSIKRPQLDEVVRRSPLCDGIGRFFFLLAIALLGYCILLIILIRASAAAEGILMAKKDWPMHHGPWRDHFLEGWLPHVWLIPVIAAFSSLVSLALRPKVMTGLLFFFLLIGSLALFLSTFWLID